MGAALAAYFSRRGDVVIELNRQAIDLRDLSSLPPILGACDFDVLINPAALSSPDDCEKNPGLAYLVNTQAPAAMDNARLCSLLPTPAASWCEALGQWFAGSHFSLRG